MQYRDSKLGWKRLAARLLIVPVLTGAVAGVASAQVRTPSATAPVQQTATPTDPKALVKQGYDALKAGQYDVAQECATKAAAVKGYKWGLFDDTPDGLLKAVTDARSKADKAKSDVLMKQARAAYARKGRTPEETWANLDEASTLAYQAMNLHGPYAWWDVSDKPSSLLSEIESARAKLRKANPNLNTATAKTNTPATPGMKTGSKADVLKLMADARTLMAAGKPVEARAKALEARKLADTSRVTFTAGEDSPDACYQAIQADGKKMVDTLVRDADAQMAKKDYAKAEAAYAMAAKTAGELGLYATTIQDKLAACRKLTGGTTAVAATTTTMTAPAVPGIPAMPSMPNTVATGTIPAPGTGEYLVPAVPDMKVPGVAVAPTVAVPPAVPGSGTVSGKQLLAQADYELRKNDLEAAKKLAMQAYADPSAKQAAESMLATIQAEDTERKTRDSRAAFDAAVKAYHAKSFSQAHTLFKLIDPSHLPADKREQMSGLMAQCASELNRGNVVLASGQDNPGVAKIGDGQNKGPDLAEQVKAMNDLKFTALRQDGNKVMSEATALFNKGDTDIAMQMMNDFVAKVKASDLPTPRQQLLLSPVEARMANLRIVKHNMDFVTQEAKTKQNARDRIIGASLAEQQKQEEIAKSVQKVNELLKSGKLAEAEAVALRTKQLDPDNAQLEIIYTLAKRKKRLEEVTRDRDAREQLVYEGLGDAERPGPVVTAENPLKINQERYLTALRRGGDGITLTRSQLELELDRKLDKTISVNFENANVREIVAELQRQTNLNFMIDEVSITDEGINLDTATVRNIKLDNMALKTVLEMALSQARLNYVNDKGVVVVTTKRKSLGRLVTKVFSVMELVTPIPDFALAPHQNLNTALQQGKAQPPWMSNPNYGAQMGGSPVVRNPSGGLTNGQLVSGDGSAGGFQGNLVSGEVENPLGRSTTMAPSLNRGAAAEKLQNLIKYMVQSGSWEENGGPGRIKYFDAGAALVVNQTADVIGEVQNLLESLRRLQDLSVSVEVRVVSLSESFFERIGVDFNMNIRTNNPSFERQVATGIFQPAPFLNSINASGTTVGWSPATGFTPDLGVPVRPSSYGLTQPPFGGYQNFLSPTLNGGLSVGLAFLNDIQVYAFLEAASGDRRTNVMQAPKITLFNGQTSTVLVQDFAYFTTGVTAFNFGGQVIFQPQNSVVPIGNATNPNGNGGLTGVSVAVQAVIMADRRFVRLNLSPQLSGLTSANVPLFPVTVFITPVFEGGSQGQPIPFTQFYQQPSFSQIEVQTTVSVPDGGTVLLGGLKAMSEGRNEFGPPVISQIPYLNRLFKNVGVGRETRHIMIMVTPRIIINSEEEVSQTGGNTGN